MTTAQRRDLLCSAALEVIAGQGLRGLTHRAVDREAGLPEGTTSAYYRSRSALQSALAAFVTDRLGQDVAMLSDDLAEGDLADARAVRLIAARFTAWLYDSRLILARIELALEATRDDVLAGTLLEGRRRIIDLVAGLLTGHGVATGSAATHRAEVMVAAYDGILLAALLKPTPDRPAFIDLAVADILRPLGQEP